MKFLKTIEYEPFGNKHFSTNRYSDSEINLWKTDLVFALKSENAKHLTQDYRVLPTVDQF